MKKKILLLTMMLSVSVLAGCKDGGEKNATEQMQNEVAQDETGLAAETEESEQTETEQPESEQIETGQAESEKTETETEDTQKSEKHAKQEPAAGEFSFADVADREFYFSSGAGGWYTVLYIHEDGTFEGHYQDSDMGVTDTEYPNGTMFFSEFTGAFTEPEKIDDTTYVFEIASIEYPCGFGEEVKDGVLYDYGTAYGLDGAKELYMYLPGTKVWELPEGFLSWVDYYYVDSLDGTELPYYGLYNVAMEEGFSSHIVLTSVEDAALTIQIAEENVAELEKKLEGTLSQPEMNEISYQIYKEWDDALNDIWGILKSELNEETMAALTIEEREWITQKEEAVKKAGEENGGGSLQPLLENDTAAEMTKERVYELFEYLKK